MKLLAIIFIAVISVSSVLPSSGEAAETVRCPEGHRIDGSVCRATVVGTRSCRAVNLPNFLGEAECIVSNKNCNLPNLPGLPGLPGLTDPSNDTDLSNDNSNDNRRLADENLAQSECEDGFTYDATHNACILIVDRGSPCPKEQIVKGDRCKAGFNEIVVCGENTDLPSGCTKRRYERDSSMGSCKKYYKEINNPKGGQPLCEFIDGSLTRFCDNYTTLDETSQKCLPYWDTGSARCNIGRLVDGRCKEVLTSPRKYSCPRESDLSDVEACFRGTVKGNRCMVSERVETYLNCPEGYSPVDASTSTTCQSEATTQPIPL